MHATKEYMQRASSSAENPTGWHAASQVYDHKQHGDGTNVICIGQQHGSQRVESRKTKFVPQSSCESEVFALVLILKEGEFKTQICEFLGNHAHERMLSSQPIVPETVCDQIMLWETEHLATGALP